jgi:transposase
MEHRKLTPTEKQGLIERHRKERDKRTCDRIKAVLAFDDGYSYSEISRLLLLDDETIRRHVASYFSHYKLSPEQGGSQSYLMEHQMAELKIHLETATYLYVKDICAYVENVFGKPYSISGMTKWLKGNGFCYKKPHGVPAKADAAAQQTFMDDYSELKSTLSSEEVLYFVDSSHPSHQTQLAYGWIKKGQRKAVKMTNCQKRLNLIGGINLTGHQIEYRQVDWVNTESIQDFLTQLIESNPLAKKIHIIWDNAGYHKSEAIRKFVSERKICLHYLPPYSPNLNPIERLWKVMHEQVTYNRYYPKLADFTKGILDFFTNIGKYKTIIQARINDNFQRLALA